MKYSIYWTNWASDQFFLTASVYSMQQAVRCAGVHINSYKAPIEGYSRHQKKVPISRPYNGTGNSVLFPFPFNFRAVAVFKPFPFCPTGSLSVLVNGPYGVIKYAQSLIAVISAGRLATVQ